MTDPMMGARIFQLHRDRDVTGVSGTGHVATGVVFEDGTGVTHWMTGHISTVVWHTGEHSNPPDTMEAALRDVHQHIDPNTGLPATRVVWLEPLGIRHVERFPASIVDEHIRYVDSLLRDRQPEALISPGGWCAPVDQIQHRDRA